MSLNLRSKAATIRRLAPDISHCLGLGYSMQQLLDVLQEAGLPPTPLSSLKSTLTRMKSRQQRLGTSKGQGDEKAEGGAP